MAEKYQFKPHDPNSNSTALCLSGGGYRAMLFHVGTLRRLNELGMLRTLKRISAVSGGSVASGFLAVVWGDFRWNNNNVAENFDEVYVKPMMEQASKTILAPFDVQAHRLLFRDAAADAYAKLKSWLRIGSDDDRDDHGHIADVVIGALGPLLRNKSLQDLPATDQPNNPAPEFYFNATNVQTGNLFIFTKTYCGEIELGYIHNPDLPLAVAVTASAAFPPVISPLCLNTSKFEWHENKTPHGSDDTASTLAPTTPNARTLVAPSGHSGRPKRVSDLVYVGCGLEKMRHINPAEFDRVRNSLRGPWIYLADGGVYDNLGLETSINKFDVVLVSDGGMACKIDHRPHREVVFHGLRISDLVDHQVRCLRKRQLLKCYLADHNESIKRRGAYWSITGTCDVQPEAKFDPPTLDDQFPPQRSEELANVPTVLEKFSSERIHDLIDWGYARCDTILRLWHVNTPEKCARYGVPSPVPPPKLLPRADADSRMSD